MGRVKAWGWGMVFILLVGCDRQEPAEPTEATSPAAVSASVSPVDPPPSEATAMPVLKPLNQQEATDSGTTLYLRFFTSGESFYDEIKLEEGVLSHTYFEDTTNRCAQWVQSRPCWRQEDLKTRSAVLPTADIDNLYAVIGESGILDITETKLGGAKAGQRYYAQHLELRMGGIEKHLIYQSFPKATPKPEGFLRLETALIAYARSLPQE